ncbi:MAG: DeoR/GlpR family DNA-binding transcription regulator [Nocardioidaceae bacterium]
MPDVRRDAIAAEVARHGAVRTEDLAQRFDVSIETIRRDLLALEERGLLRRVFGGARSAGGRTTEPSFEERAVLHLTAKQAMARLAAGLIGAGDSVFMDIGTSVAEVARALPVDLPCRVLTNSMLVANELVDRPQAEVTVSGGRLRRGDLALSGPDAQRFFEGYYADRVFLGSGGVDPVAGLTDFHTDEIAVRRVLITHATERFVLADSSKLGLVALGKVCDISELTGVITDDGADPAVIEALRGARVEVLVAPTGSAAGVAAGPATP